MPFCSNCGVFFVSVCPICGGNENVNSRMSNMQDSMDNSITS